MRPSSIRAPIWLGLVLGAARAGGAPLAVGEPAALTPGRCAALTQEVRVETRKVRSDLLWIALDIADRCAAVPGLEKPRRAAYHLAGGNVRLMLGDYAAAEGAFRRALALDGADADAAFGLAEALRERPEEALPFAEKAVRGAQSRRRRAAALRLGGQIRLDLGDAAGARRSFARALELAGEDLEILEDMARAARTPPEASAHALRALKAAGAVPLWLRPAAYRFCARLGMEIGDHALAADSLGRALRLDTDDLPALQLLVKLRRTGFREPPAGGGRPRESQESSPAELSEAAAVGLLESQAEDLEALRRLIEIRRTQGRPAEAAALAGRFMDAALDSPAWKQPDAYHLVGKIWLELGDMEMARQSLWHARNMEPRSVAIMTLAARIGAGEAADDNPVPADLHADIAAARLELDDAAGAERSLERALALTPGHLPALEGFARLRLGQGRPREALAYCDRALEASEGLKKLGWEAAARYGQVPVYISALHELRARSRLELGDEAGAEESLERALGLAPGALGPQKLIIELHQRKARRQALKNPREARATLARARALAEALVEHSRAATAPDRAAAFRLKAQIEIELDDAGAGENSLKRALELVPGDPQTLGELIGIEIARGRTREALAHSEALVEGLRGAHASQRAAAYRQKARIELDLKDAAAAGKSLALALTLSSGDPQTLEELVGLEFGQGRPREALAHAGALISASRAAPAATLAAAYRRKAQIELSLKDASAAGESFRRILELLPGDPQALDELTRIELAAGRPREALVHASALAGGLQSAPAAERAAAHRRKARIELAIHDASAAGKSFGRVLELLPGDPRALDELVRLELAAGRPREALAHAAALVGASRSASAAERAAACLRKARIELGLKDAAAAAKSFKRALQLLPGDPSALEGLMRLEMERGRPRKALAHAVALVEVFRTAPARERAAAYRARAQIEVELGEASAAAASLTRILELIPGDPEALAGLAHLKLAGGRAREALVHASALVEASRSAPVPERAAAYRRKARIELELKDPAAAAESLRRILELIPGDPDALSDLVEIELAGGRAREALVHAAALASAARAGPERAAACRRQARIEIDLGDFAAAEKSLERALEALPDDPAPFWLRLADGASAPRDILVRLEARWPADPAAQGRWLAVRGLARAGLGDRPGAEADIKAGVRADAAGVCFILAPAYRDRLDVLFFDHCLRSFPDDSKLHVDRGVARYRLGLADGAIRDFRKAISLRPENLEARLSLVSALAAQGRLDDALREADRAVARAESRGGQVRDHLVGLQSRLRRSRAEVRKP